MPILKQQVSWPVKVATLIAPVRQPWLDKVLRAGCRLQRAVQGKQPDRCAGLPSTSNAPCSPSPPPTAHIGAVGAGVDGGADAENIVRWVNVQRPCHTLGGLAQLCLAQFRQLSAAAEAEVGGLRCRVLQQRWGREAGSVPGGGWKQKGASGASGQAADFVEHGAAFSNSAFSLLTSVVLPSQNSIPAEDRKGKGGNIEG